MRRSNGGIAIIVVWAVAGTALPVRGAAPDSLSAAAAAQGFVGPGAQMRRAVSIPDGYRRSGSVGWLFDFVEHDADSSTTQIAVEFADNAWSARAYDYQFRFDHSGSPHAILLRTPIDMESACRVLNAVRARLFAEETISSIRSFDDVFTGFDADGKAVLSNSDLDGRVGVWTTTGSAGGRIFSVRALGDTCITEIAGHWY